MRHGLTANAIRVMQTASTISLVVICFLSVLPGAFAAGPGFSGITATADSAETVANNPAGMMRLKKPSLYGNPLIMYTRSETEVSAPSTGRKQTTSDESFIAMPGLSYTRPLGERWAIGIGPNAAMGLGASYDDEWVGRYLIQEWSLTFAGLSPAVAYRFNRQLSVGASAPIMYSRYTLEKAVFNLDSGAGDGSLELESDGWGVGATIGILYELTENTRFGLVYRSKISVTQEDTPEFSNLTQDRINLLNRFGALDQEISFDTSVPQIATVGIFHDFRNGWSCSLDAAWVDFSDWGFEDVAVGDTEVASRSGNYKDIWAVSIGINRELTPKWTAGSGAFYASSPLDEEDRTAFTRFDEMWGLGLGIEYHFQRERSVSFDMTYIQFGDGRFQVQDAPVVGDLEGEYTTNYAIVLGVAVKR